MKSISGKFTKVSKSYDKNSNVLISFVGDLWPHDLTSANIEYIKSFYSRPGWNHKFLDKWPEDIEPWYPAAKSRTKNRFMLIYKN